MSQYSNLTYQERKDIWEAQNQQIPFKPVNKSQTRWKRSASVSYKQEDFQDSQELLRKEGIKVLRQSSYKDKLSFDSLKP